MAEKRNSRSTTGASTEGSRKRAAGGDARAAPTAPGKAGKAKPKKSTEPKAPASSARDERVRDRAYRIWEQEGRPEGREREHWQQAEREEP